MSTKHYSGILVLFIDIYIIAIAYADIKRLTEGPCKRGTFFHCATVISMPKNPFPVSASIKLLTLLIWG